MRYSDEMYRKAFPKEENFSKDNIDSAVDIGNVEEVNGDKPDSGNADE